MSGSETRAAKTTHPALALLRAGDAAEALTCLRERDDAPAALALLEAGFTDYAETVLQRHLAGSLQASDGAGRRMTPGEALAGLETQETGQSVDVRRRA